MKDMPLPQSHIKYPREKYRDEYDMSYASARAYQAQVVKILKEIFGDDMVKSEWDSTTYDGHTSNHKLVYAPRIDIAVGPFNSFADLDVGIDQTAGMKSHPLVKKLMDRTDIVWNNCARCFLAIEIVFSGKSKYIAGDLLNATSTGAIGFIVTHRDMHKGVSGMLNYFHRLEEYERLHEKKGLGNLMVFQDYNFLEFLWELKNPENLQKLKIDDRYRIAFRHVFWPRSFTLTAHTSRYKPNLTQDAVTRLAVYGFDLAEVMEEHFFVLMATRYTYPCTAYVYQITTPSGDHVRLMDIIDIAVNAEYRNKGVGTRVLKIFEKVARENGCQYICVEMGSDRAEEPIDKQKGFFERNGFTVWHDDRTQFSGWFGKKPL